MKNQILRIFTGLISIWFLLLSCSISEKDKKEIQQKCDSTQIIPSLSFSIKDDSNNKISMVIIKEKNNTNTVDSFSVPLMKVGKYPQAALKGSIRKPVNISHSYEFFINQKLAFIVSDFRLGLTEHRNNFNRSVYGCELIEYKLNGKKIAGSSLELK